MYVLDSKGQEPFNFEFDGETYSIPSRQGLPMPVFRSIQKAIDEGLPMIWTMWSSNVYGERANQNTHARQTMTTEQWLKTLKKQKKIKDVHEGPHICLVIGYNATTNEIAVSNSWGNGPAALWWVRMDDAEVVARGKLVYLRP